jgi:hypothetical protein
MPLRQKLCIARNHPLGVAELPNGGACIGHSVALTTNSQTIMVERRDVGKRTWHSSCFNNGPLCRSQFKREAHMTAISGGRVTDERVTCLRILANANGETHMVDFDIALQPRKLFKDNPPLRLSDNLAASWCNICHVPTDMCEVDWRNPPQRLLVLWLTGEIEFETSDGDIRLHF